MAALGSIRAAATSPRLLWQQLRPGKMDTRTACLIALVVLAATAPLELSQVTFAILGAVTYALLQSTSAAPRRAKATSPRNKGASPEKGEPPKAQPKHAASATPAPAPLRRGPKVHSPKFHNKAAPPATQECWQPSSQPVARVHFTSVGWDAEVQELLGQISPTAEGDRVVQDLALAVKQSLCMLVPEAEVYGFASGDLLRGTAFGVAVPEVDIVVNVTPRVLATRLQGRSSKFAATSSQLDVRKLQKSAVRAFTDQLVSSGGFKFRRSAFRSQDPKVTLLAPASLGIHTEAIPIDFSVNSATPLHNAALLTECGQIEPRARELIMLVKRWAKDRGVCHAAKGHLSPYSWSLLTIYFLQTGAAGDRGPMLPPLEGFGLSAGLANPDGNEKLLTAARKAGAPPPRAAEGAAADTKKSVGTLLKEFMQFYCRRFDPRNEAVSVRLGRRAPPCLALPLHIVLHSDGVTTEVGINIEDPFDQRRNLGDCATAASLARLREELSRADRLCSQGTSLAELLEPWAPEEREAGERGGDGADDGP